MCQSTFQFSLFLSLSAVPFASSPPRLVRFKLRAQTTKRKRRHIKSDNWFIDRKSVLAFSSDFALFFSSSSFASISDPIMAFRSLILSLTLVIKVSNESISDVFFPFERVVNCFVVNRYKRKSKSHGTGKRNGTKKNWDQIFCVKLSKDLSFDNAQRR